MHFRKFQVCIEQHIPESVSSRGIPKFTQISYGVFPFHLIFPRNLRLDYSHFGNLAIFGLKFRKKFPHICLFRNFGDFFWMKSTLVIMFGPQTNASLILRSSLNFWDTENWRVSFLVEECLPSYPPSVRSLSEVWAPAMYAGTEMKLDYCRYLWSEFSSAREKPITNYNNCHHG